MIKIFFDGLCEPVNPRGIATYAYVIYDENDKILGEGFGLAAEPYSSSSTNNVAEYAGLICGLKNGLAYSKQAIVFGDSALIIKQMKKEYRVRSRKLLPYHECAEALSKMYEKINFFWVPREENSRADQLTRIAYELFLSGKLSYKEFLENCCSGFEKA